MGKSSMTIELSCSTVCGLADGPGPCQQAILQCARIMNADVVAERFDHDSAASGETFDQGALMLAIAGDRALLEHDPPVAQIGGPRRSGFFWVGIEERPALGQLVSHRLEFDRIALAARQHRENGAGR